MLSRLFTRKEQMIMALFSTAIVLGAATVYVREFRSADFPPAETVEVTPASAPVGTPREIEPPVVVLHDPMPYPPPNPQSVEVVVSILGAVTEPGVYKMDGDARIQDLIDAAGGVGVHVDLSDINLAAPLIDGTTLTLPYSITARNGSNGVVIERKSSMAAWNPPEYTISGWSGDGQSADGAVLSIATNDAVAEPLPPPSDPLINVNTASSAELQTLAGIGPKLANAIIQRREIVPFSSVNDLLNVSGIGPKRLEAIQNFVMIE